MDIAALGTALAMDYSYYGPARPADGHLRAGARGSPAKVMGMWTSLGGPSNAARMMRFSSSG